MAGADANASVDAQNATQTPVPRRFSILESTEKERIIDGLHSANTIRATKRAVNTFQAWLSESSRDNVDLSVVPVAELDQILADFWLAARTKTGDYYKSSSLINMRHGINRHLKALGRNMDVVKDTVFQESNKTLAAMMKELKRVGKGATEHHEPLSVTDLQKCYNYFAGKLFDLFRVFHKLDCL